MRILVLLLLLNLFAAELVSAKGKETTVKVDFQWDAVPDAIAYEVEFKNDKFSKIFNTRKAELNVKLPPGLYQMKLRALDQRGVPGEWSEPSEIEAWPQTVQLSSEHDAKGTPVPGTTKAQVKLNWPELATATKYQVQIKDKNKKIIIKQWRNFHWQDS